MTAHAKPSISIRKYIKWGDGPRLEPTSTMVLTSPQRRFVDVRLLLPLPPPPPPLPLGSSSAATTPVVAVGLVEERVDWAFAGTSRHDDAGAEPPHSVFAHWVDSRHADAGAVRDEGDVFPGEAEGEDVERGRMVNPESGKEEAYEECWVDGGEEEAEAEAEAGWVLRHESPGEGGGGARGMVVKIGRLAQGVLRARGDVGVGRWVVGDHGGPGQVVAEVGRCGGFPVGVLGRAMQVGEEAQAQDGTCWVCVESW